MTVLHRCASHNLPFRTLTLYFTRTEEKVKHWLDTQSISMELEGWIDRHYLTYSYKSIGISLLAILEWELFSRYRENVRVRILIVCLIVNFNLIYFCIY